MIEITPNTAIIAYLSLSLFALLALWCRQLYSAPAKIELLDKKLFVCEHCSFAYLEKSGKALNRCPQCHFLNKGNEYKNLSNDKGKL